MMLGLNLLFPFKDFFSYGYSGSSLAVTGGSCSSLRCAGFPSRRLRLLQTQALGARALVVAAQRLWRVASVTVTQGLSGPLVCGIFPDLGLNLCPLHWQEESLLLSQQGHPWTSVLNRVPPSGREGWLKGNLAGERVREIGEGLTRQVRTGWILSRRRKQRVRWLCSVSDKPIWESGESLSVMSDSLRRQGLHSPWNSPGQNTGVGSPSILQGIFPTQGSNPGLPCCRRILYQLSRQGSLEVGWGQGKRDQVGRPLSPFRDKERGIRADGAKGKVRGQLLGRL